MSLKDIRRDNNVDATRSTMQKKVNHLHKLLSNHMLAAQRKNRKVQQLRGFIGRLMTTGVIPREEFKNFIQNGKTHHAREHHK